jgi:methionine synthase I (cobalamin-dependent)/5,10-methylenetetrahydrofolate reductase
MEFLDELQERIVPGDGAMGTLLIERGVPLDHSFEELCLSAPDTIRSIHTEYIAAGARVIETNSFGANAVRLARHRLERRVSEINWSAAQLARECARGHGVYVAGSVGPLGISAEQAKERGIDRRAVFNEQIGGLLDGGAQLIFLETFLDLEELLIALEVKQSLHHCPAICSLACNEEGRLSNGISVKDAFARLRAADADVVGVNCVNGPQAMVRLFERAGFDGLVSAFPNAGYPQFFEGRFLYFTTPEYFARAAVQLAQNGARLIGGCCGTGPAHVAAMAQALRDFVPSHPQRVTVERTVTESRLPTAVTEIPAGSKVLRSSDDSSLVERVSQGRTVIVTELDPPKTLELERFFAGAQALHAAGCDAVTLADNSLAILRVSNLATGALLKERFGITPLLHLSCRDRNVIGLQSELMGMTALGIRHVLPLTGDPAKVGDHPGATSVYDVTSIELLKIIQQLNAGMNANGKSIRRGAGLVAGCTFNPGVRNIDAQLQRLERKVAAGAQFVMTQPVFDVELVERTAKRTERFGVPVFIGVWPLLSGRQAEFLHNEVPGIAIPEEVRESMRGLEGTPGRSRGIEIARDVCRAVLDHFPGVYLITPFLHYDITVELTQFVRIQ